MTPFEILKMDIQNALDSYETAMGLEPKIIRTDLMTSEQRFLASYGQRESIKHTRKDRDEIIMKMRVIFKDTWFGSADALRAVNNPYLKNAREVGAFLKYESVQDPTLFETRLAGGNLMKYKFRRIASV